MEPTEPDVPIAPIEPIKLEFKYVEADYIEAVRLVNMRGSRRVWDYVAGAVAIAFGLYSGARGGFSGLWIALASLGMLLILMAILSDHVLPGVWFRREPKFQDAYTLTFMDEGLDFRTSRLHSLIEWDFYRSLVEGPHTYLLMYGKRQFSAIPKRAFTSPEQEARFKALVEAKLAAPKPAA